MTTENTQITSAPGYDVSNMIFSEPVVWVYSRQQT